MSDELNSTESTEGPENNEEPQGAESQTDWKTEARKWEKRAKEANSYKEAADKWHNYEASQKPEQERLADQLAKAQAEAESARTWLLRYEVAAEKNIPAEAIKLLHGSTREELDEAADVLLGLIAEQSKPKSPKPDVSQGKPAGKNMSTADAFAAAIGDLL